MFFARVTHDQGCRASSGAFTALTPQSCRPGSRVCCHITSLILKRPHSDGDATTEKVLTVKINPEMRRLHTIGSYQCTVPTPWFNEQLAAELDRTVRVSQFTNSVKSRSRISSSLGLGSQVYPIQTSLGFSAEWQRKENARNREGKKKKRKHEELLFYRHSL